MKILNDYQQSVTKRAMPAPRGEAFFKENLNRGEAFFAESFFGFSYYERKYIL